MANVRTNTMDSRRGSGGTETQLQVAPSTIKSTNPCIPSKRPSQKGSSFGRGTSNVLQMRGGDSSRDRSGFLFPSFCGNEKIWRSSSSNRSEGPQFVPKCPSFQDGISPHYQSTTPQGRVCSVTGHERCLFPCRCTQTFQEIYEVLHRGHSLSIPRHVFWPGNGSNDFHEGTSTSRSLSQASRHRYSYVSGRLAYQSKKSRSASDSHSKSSRHSQASRNSHKSRKVRTHSHSEIRVSRSSVRSRTREGVSHRRESVKDQNLVEVPSSISQSNSKELPITLGSTQSHERSCNSGKTPPSASPVLSQVLLETEGGLSGDDNSSRPNVFSVSGLVGVGADSPSRHRLTFTGLDGDDSHRRESVKVGGASGESGHIRSLDSSRIQVTHQPSGNEGCDVNFRTLQESDSKSVCVNHERQHNCSILHQTSRRDSLPSTVQSDQKAVRFYPTIQHNPESLFYSRPSQHNGGLFESKGTSLKDRMDTVEQSIQTDPDTVSVVGIRPVRNLSEQPATFVCEPSSRRPVLGHRCPGDQLGGSSSLCIPPNQFDSPGFKEDRGNRLSDSTNSTELADSTLVPGATPTVGGVSAGAAVTQTVAPPTPISDFPYEARSVRPSRLAFVKERIMEEGFSEAVADMASRPQRKSSLSVYQSHFTAFSDWCNQRGTSLESVSIPIVADYLLFLFTEQKREVATISSHRTALSAALGTFNGFTVGDHPVLSKLISSFYAQRPPNRLRVPEWNLLTVLNKLLESPFEPPAFDTVQQKKLLTWKTVFLLALACAKRASELHALSRDPADLKFDNNGVWLRSVPHFLAKTQRPNTCHKSFFVPRLDTYTGRDTPDRKLCPVRMLKYYIKFSGGTVKNERLFKKCVGGGDLCSKTISSWLKNCIKYCHEDKSVKAKGHEVRRLSTSWALASGASVKDILEAASWASTTTFTSYYLVDVVQ